MNRQSDLHIREQAIAEIVGVLNAERMQNLAKEIRTQDGALLLALQEIDRVRTFIAAPEHILGRLNTKHGEIAEQLEIGIRRAYDALEQMPFSATLENVHRTGPVDYQINGIDVQSKYINGARNTLDHIRSHLEKYAGFGIHTGYYHVPKDQYAEMAIAYKGGIPEGFSPASSQRLREKIQEAIDKTGRSFSDLIRPGSFDYSEAQLGSVSDTLDRDEQNIRHAQDEAKKTIDEQHQPSLGEATKGAAVAGMLAAGLGFGYAIYKKQKSGKSIFELNADDWKEIGVDSAKAGGSGTVTAFAIYGLTNFTDMPAPLAGAIASTARGIYLQIELHRVGKLSEGQLIDNSLALGSEAGIVALCSVAGQAAIPVPVLGSVIGSIVGKFVSKIILDQLGKSGEGLARQIKDRTYAAIDKLDAKYQELLKRLTTEFDDLDDLIIKAFDPRSNSRLVQLSIQVAEELQVPNGDIIRDYEHLDRYIGTNQQSERT